MAKLSVLGSLQEIVFNKISVFGWKTHDRLPSLYQTYKLGLYSHTRRIFENTYTKHSKTVIIDIKKNGQKNHENQLTGQGWERLKKNLPNPISFENYPNPLAWPISTN